MARIIRTCICEICKQEFQASTNARACPGECRRTLFSMIQTGEKIPADKAVKLIGTAIDKEYAAAKRANLYLTSKPTVSYKTLQKTNIQAMQFAVK